MKIVENTPDRLVLEDRPTFVAIALSALILAFVGVGLGLVLSGNWWGLLFGLAGVVIGGAFMALLVRRHVAILDRPSGFALIRQTSLLGRTEARHALETVAAAVLEERPSSRGSTTYRPALRLADDTLVPLRWLFTSGPAAGQAVSAIDDWLDRRQA